MKPADGRRIIYDDEHFIAFVPFFARFPFEVHLFPKEHRTALTELSRHERRSLARTLKVVLMKYDQLWGFPLPYMMVQHARPTDGGDYRHFHFHIEFYPLHRTAAKLKYLAGSETGAGAFIVDATAEAMAAKLRAVAVEFEDGEQRIRSPEAAGSPARGQDEGGTNP